MESRETYYEYTASDIHVPVHDGDPKSEMEFLMKGVY